MARPTAAQLDDPGAQRREVERLEQQGMSFAKALARVDRLARARRGTERLPVPGPAG
jgi:hypothetical protein